jgi:hypothetical protein
MGRHHAKKVRRQRIDLRRPAGYVAVAAVGAAAVNALMISSPAAADAQESARSHPVSAQGADGIQGADGADSRDVSVDWQSADRWAGSYPRGEHGSSCSGFRAGGGSRTGASSVVGPSSYSSASAGPCAGTGSLHGG